MVFNKMYRNYSIFRRNDNYLERFVKCFFENFNNITRFKFEQFSREQLFLENFRSYSHEITKQLKKRDLTNNFIMIL